MPYLIIYHITRIAKGWKAMREGAERALMTAETKEEIVKKFNDWAKKSATDKNPISVRIHAVDGKIQEERTYPRSADPKGSRR
jgi:hypothetical protein